MLPAVRKPSSGGRFSTIGGAAAAAGGLPGASDCDASLIGFWIFPLRNRKERSDDVEPFTGVWEESGQSAGGRRRGSGNRETLWGRRVLLDRRRWRTLRFGGDTSVDRRRLAPVP